MCAQKVWEVLLTDFQLDHKHMQTVLLTMGYIGNLSIEDVLKSVLMATLKASTNRSLRDAYHNE